MRPKLQPFRSKDSKIQILRIIATSPEMDEVMDANAQILQEMSMMALLRQSSLKV